MTLGIQLLMLEDQRNQNLSPRQYQRHGLVILVSLGGFWQILLFYFRMMNTDRCVNSSTLKCQKQQLKVCGIMDFLKDIMVYIKDLLKRLLKMSNAHQKQTAIAWPVSAKARCIINMN